MAKIADASTLGYFKDTIWNEGIDLIIMCVFINSELAMYRASLVAQMVKYLPAMKETQVSSMGQEDPLVKGMATHSSILIWRIP